jgi:hypothetical protein
MRRRSQLTILLALLFLLPFLHLEIERSDESWLLLVDGRPVDIAGRISQFWTSATLQCERTEVLPAHHPLHIQTLDLIRTYSLPDSLTANVVALNRVDQWLLAQVKFERLEPAVVVLQISGLDVVIPQGGIWSGPTFPHTPEPLIRRFIASRVPGVPSELLGCFAYEL